MNRAFRNGLTLPRDTTTTAHLAAVYPFSVEGGLPATGPFLGRNVLAGGGGFFFDPFAAYHAGLITAPNMMISGAGGYGKSAVAKTLVWRSAAIEPTGTRPRFVAVIDPKGEWVPLASRLGLAVVALVPGGPHRVNPLDAAFRAGDGSPSAPDGATQVVAALLAVVLDRDLSVGEERVSAHAIDIVATRRRSATLHDLRALLAAPTHELANRLDLTIDELQERSRDMVDALAKLLDHDLRGMFDEHTNISLDWQNSRGLVIDLSALLENRKALKLVLIAAAGWLQSVMHRQRDREKVNIIDEGWIALENLATVRYLQDAWRLGRQFGTANILITHAFSDLRSQADDGSALTKIADGLLHTTSVRVFLHQHNEQVAELLTRAGLTRTEAELLPHLRAGQALWKISGHSALVEHVIADTEWSFCNTTT
jgi:type IV secretory pathway VirB4 component